MKALLLLSVLALTAAADLADVKPVADVGVVADVEIVGDFEAIADVATAVPELQEDNQLEEDELHINEEEYAAMLDVAEIDSPINERFFSCPSGWERYRSNCYSYVSSSYSWSSAESYCAGQGSSLASASDLFEYTFLQSLTSRAGGQTAWIGGYYFQTWRWVDQSRFSYTNWYSQNTPSSYPCIYLRTTGGWYNYLCSTGRPFICVRRTDTC
ncbi:galactose-specific lectin nattectin-like [Labrus mixtus]|uniref:galactose-specific lectin nattectin-like n=1 Tax=Labrus mixtus TaxID=508554 RepID=UPI0029C095DA|nr:galactose-specific lectin nattectin-like [Labrus mixtus]